MIFMEDSIKQLFNQVWILDSLTTEKNHHPISGSLLFTKVNNSIKKSIIKTSIDTDTVKNSYVPWLFIAVAASTASASALWMKPCYHGDDCATYQYNGGSDWNNGKCYNLPQGMASFGISDGVQQCILYNKNNSDESGSVWVVTTSNQWFNSEIGCIGLNELLIASCIQ
jgi:hypothetical protein